MGIYGGLYMLLVDFAEGKLAGVLVLFAVSLFWDVLRIAFDPLTTGVCLLIGGLLPAFMAVDPVELSTRFRLGLYIDFWLFTMTSFFSCWLDEAAPADCLSDDVCLFD